MKFSLSWIFLIIPGLILLSSCFVNSVPGALLSFYLVGIAFCIPSIGFSRGWAKGAGVAFAIIFIVISFQEQKRGLDYERFKWEALEEAKQKNSIAEPGDAENGGKPIGDERTP